MPESKPTIDVQYQNLNDLKKQFNDELVKAAASGDLSKAQILRTELEGKLELIKDEISPYELGLRKEIARDRDFRYVGMFSPEGVARAQNQNNGWLYINRKGEQVPVDSEYTFFKSALPLKEGIGIVKQYNTSNTDLVAAKPHINPGLGYMGGYSAVIQANEGIIPYKSIGGIMWNYMDTDGTQLNLSPDGRGFNDAGIFSSGLARVSKGNNYYYINRNGEHQFGDKTFSRRTDFSDGFAFVYCNPTDVSSNPIARSSGFFVMNKDGYINTDRGYEDARPFSEGQAAVKGGGLWYYIGHPATPLISARGTYEEAGFFSEGLALVKNMGKQYFITKEGFMAFPLEYDQSFVAEPFSEGVAKLSFVGREIYIDHKGREIKEFGDAGK